MSHNLQFYIDGRWVDPVGAKFIDVVDPSSESPFARIAAGSQADVDRAVAAARRAFRTFGRTKPAERLALLERVVAAFRRRQDDLADTISREMGAPLSLARDAQVWCGRIFLENMIEVLKSYSFEQPKGTTLIVREPIGVVGMITPWNWPLAQIISKVAAALSAGCTMVLKPSEIAPLDAIIFAEILDEAGLPAGVFNLVNGDGPTVGQALASHPEVDMVSITGSTRAGILVAKAAADTVKRVHQELGGKSANILFPDADFEEAVTKGVDGCFHNSGQNCNAPTRMFVPRGKQDDVIAYARKAASAYTVGPASQDLMLGPVASELQFGKIQDLIESGIREGATLVSGGPGRPAGMNSGYFVRPTVFADVTPQMRIAREEIFGPVLSILPYDSVETALEQANDSVYGLASYIQSRDLKKAREAARLMRVGSVHINYPAWDPSAPFGGYKQSGNGREHGEFGLEDFLEIKAILGYGAIVPRG